MHNKNHTSKSSFLEAEKFLQNILELRKITTRLLKDREGINENLKKLSQIVQSLCDEIQRSDNK